MGLTLQTADKKNNNMQNCNDDTISIKRLKGYIMAELVADCPRCGAKQITFDLYYSTTVPRDLDPLFYREVFCQCRACDRATIFVLTLRDVNCQDSFDKLHTVPVVVNSFTTVYKYISLRDVAPHSPPQHLPQDVESAFREGATCLTVECYNAAATMFRLCLDIATRNMLPSEGAQKINARTRNSLGLRLAWLFDHELLPNSLRELSDCIKDDGNDGAHQGTLTKEDAWDIYDFSYELLERIYTEPQRIMLAKERRDKRRETQE